MTRSPSSFTTRFLLIIVLLMVVALPLFPVLWMLGSGTMPMWM
ncbi:MAG: hypothetical protein VX641_04405 [Planctomycetota bacterium]|nr:hypothetical protein [Planctomycetota bacterium]